MFGHTLYTNSVFIINYDNNILYYNGINYINIKSVFYDIYSTLISP